MLVRSLAGMLRAVVLMGRKALGLLVLIATVEGLVAHLTASFRVETA